MTQASAVLEVQARAPETQVGYDGANNDPPPPHYLGGADDESGFRTQEEHTLYRLITAANSIANRQLIALNPDLYSRDLLRIQDRRGLWGQAIGAVSFLNQPFGTELKSA